ncbi:MAG: hypothetical protein RBJ76_05665 [Stenomitos frigidus ULC029]
MAVKGRRGVALAPEETSLPCPFADGDGSKLIVGNCEEQPDTIHRMLQTIA